jgi:hypothetical protein
MTFIGYILFSITCSYGKNVEFLEDIDVYDLIVEPENRYAFTNMPLRFHSFHNSLFRSGTSSIFEADEDLSISYYGFVICLAIKDIIHSKASQLVESGIMQRHIQDTIVQEDKKPKPEAIGPQVLTVQHLSASFIIILGFLTLSFIVFLAECAPKLMKKLKKQFEMCLMCYVVVKFTMMNKML